MHFGVPFHLRTHTLSYRANCPTSILVEFFLVFAWGYCIFTPLSLLKFYRERYTDTVRVQIFAHILLLYLFRFSLWKAELRFLLYGCLLTNSFKLSLHDWLVVSASQLRKLEFKVAISFYRISFLVRFHGEDFESTVQSLI